MRVVVSGGTGFVGQALVRALAERGDEVVVLTRGGADLPRGAVAQTWTPTRGGDWQKAIDGAGAVIHLAGSPVAVRWNERVRRDIVESRVESARLLVEAIGAASRPPASFVSASGIGYYGSDRPGEILTEESSTGDDFLADVCRKWEGAADEALAQGARVTKLRFGIVFGRGGALDRMILPGKVGVGRVGAGKNEMSWVHLDDVVSMLLWALDGDRAGTFNCTAPAPRSAREIAAAIGRAIARPVIPAPTLALRMTLGEAAEVLVGSQHAVPARALAEGFVFAHPELEGALAAIFSGD